MPDIKTREIVKDVKAIDKAVVAGERMRSAFVRTKDWTENLMDDGQVSPSEYAEDKIRYAVEDTAQEVGHGVKRGAERNGEKVREARHLHQETKRNADTAKQAERSSACLRKAQNRMIKSTHRFTKTIKQTAKSTGQATAKAKRTTKITKKGIKTAQQTSKTVIKTAENTAKTSKTAVQAAAKAAGVATRAARATARALVAAANVTTQAMATVAKAVAAVIKALVAAIAARGWVAIVSFVDLLDFP